MLPQAKGPAFVRLASAWARPGAPESDLAADTRAAVAAVRPGDLPGAADLVEALLARLEPEVERRPARSALFALLDAVRRKPFLSELTPDLVDGWTRLLVPVIDRADYTFGELLRSREETDPRTVAIRVPGSDLGDLTVADVGRRTRSLARGLLSLLRDDPDARVAILSENRLEAALVDLACLSNGVVDIPLPANATAAQVVYMLRHSGARVLFVEDDEQVAKVLPSLAQFPELEDVIAFSTETAERHGLLTLEQMADQDGGAFADAVRATRASRVRSRDLATVMYTSGTTGMPKGITFSHLNIVSKRLCRALALPEVGEGDVLLCYLPLYHTFGRFLELTGSLWWGATYVLARSTDTPSLLEDFKAIEPTVFVSVPKKWLELHDAAVREAEADEVEEPTSHLKAITGGRLRLGLSAAGYLDPLVFKDFHRAGVQLLSGYGMTEATGGVLMTPPGDYAEGSIGKPLPGIECRRDDEGELLVRGPYVSPGYFQATGGEGIIDADGWLHTGDLVSVDERGHYRITGRKKEIYKNRAGQTISPQRVENLFRDLDAVGQAFLVGDHREYNTLLVWPAFDKDPSLRHKTPDELREMVSSLVASANRFLAPFERVMAFRVLPRALDEAHGELTRKQTFRREVVERNWRDLVEPMYQHKRLALPVGDLFLRIPNWVLREMGVLHEEVSLKGGVLSAGARSVEVGLEAAAPGSVRIGDMAYPARGGAVDLGKILARPALWVGNEGMRRLLGEDAFVSLVGRRRQGEEDTRVDPRFWQVPAPARLPGLLEQVDRDEVSFHALHAAAELVRAERPEARRAIACLERTLQSGRPDHARLARAILRRVADSPDEETRRRAFRVLWPAEDAGRTLETLRLFLDRLGPYALRDEDLVSFGERGLAEAQVSTLLEALISPGAFAALADTSDGRLLVGAMRLLTAYAGSHAAWYAAVRVPLARLTFHPDERIASRAEEDLDRLRRDFSAWIGPNQRRAIDPSSGTEYGWKEVVSFDPSVPEPAQDLLFAALADTTLMRASVFLFRRGVLLSLSDLPAGGARVSLLGSQHGKSVYRLSLQTRARETFDIAINLADGMSPSALREEIRWLLAAGAPPPLVEAFGGYYPEHGIFTEEFIPGETVERQVARLERQGETRRLKHVWPFLGWTAFTALVDFWDRTGRRVALRQPSLAVFIVPSHDYQTGARLVSIADRSPCESFEGLLDRFQGAFVDAVESGHPELAGGLGDEVLFSAAVDALGLERSRPLLEGLADTRRGPAALAFLVRLRAEGFTPRGAFFAARRYRRWLAVNPGATVEARGAILAELWGTYRLEDLEAAWPDVRVRFFRQTVFAGAREAMGAALDRLMEAVRARPKGGLNLGEHIAPLREALRPTAEEDYFLARMAYRYLRPTDEASLISLPSGEHVVTEVVVALTDEEGERFKVRAPASPREVARLLQLFLDANLLVTFTAEHEFLLALDEGDALLGGLFHRRVGRDRVHMEKIVIARQHQGKGVSGALMRELVRRLRARAVRTLETGYFRPDWFQKYGFRTDPAAGGLVLDIGEEPTTRL